MTGKVESKTVRRFKLTGTQHSALGIFKEGTFPLIVTEEDVCTRLLPTFLFVDAKTFKGKFTDDRWLIDTKEFMFTASNFVELKVRVLSEKETFKAKVDVLRFKQELMLRNMSWNMKRLHAEQFKTANIFY